MGLARCVSSIRSFVESLVASLFEDGLGWLDVTQALVWILNFDLICFKHLVRFVANWFVYGHLVRLQSACPGFIGFVWIGVWE